MSCPQYAPARQFFTSSAHRFHFAFLLLSLLLLLPLAAHAQDDPGGQNNPGGQQQDPNNPNPGPNDPEESPPVVLTASVAPERVPINSGTATLT